MTKIKTIVSGDLKERLEQKVITGKAPKHGSVLIPKYEAFAKVFGLDNFGFVTMDDFYNEIRTGEKSPVMKLDKDFMPYWTRESGLESDVLFTSSFKLKDGSFIHEKSFLEVLDYLENQQRIGNIGHVLNSKQSNLFKDKASYALLAREGVNVPEIWHFSSFDGIQNLVQNSSKSYVFKPRFGFDGVGVEKFNSSDYEKFKDKTTWDYIVQEEVDIASEIRLIFCDGEFLGSRMISDRTRPWESKENAHRHHEVLPYVPSDEEIEDSRKQQ